MCLYIIRNSAKFGLKNDSATIRKEAHFFFFFEVERVDLLSGFLTQLSGRSWLLTSVCMLFSSSSSLRYLKPKKKVWCSVEYKIKRLEINKGKKFWLFGKGNRLVQTFFSSVTHEYLNHLLRLIAHVVTLTDTKTSPTTCIGKRCGSNPFPVPPNSCRCRNRHTMSVSVSAAH